MVIIKHLRMICMFTVISNVWCFPLPTWSYKTQKAHGSHKLYCKQTHFFTFFTQLMSLNLVFLLLLCHISLNRFHTAHFVKHTNIVNLQETEVKSQETKPLNRVSKSSFCINEQVTVTDTVQPGRLNCLDTLSKWVHVGSVLLILWFPDRLVILVSLSLNTYCTSQLFFHGWLTAIVCHSEYSLDTHFMGRRFYVPLGNEKA